VFAVLSVSLEVIERHWFPGMAVGWRHAALIVWALVVALVAYGVAYLPMRRQQQRLSATAEQLTRTVQDYLADIYAGSSAATERSGHFENPHLARCWEVLNCDHADCPMHGSPGERCWQVLALRHAHDAHSARIEIEECLACRVFRESCPDKLTELGESFNNLVFLLEQGSEQVGRLRAQVVEKEKMAAIGQMAAGVAHEVGNPLSSISAIVQMLKRGRCGAAMPEQLDLIQTHIQRISTIVRQLVAMARPTGENWERVDVGQVLDEAVRLISFDWRARNVEIGFERPPSVCHTYALRGELQQVFINLALNALDAMRAGGKLTIRAGMARGIIAVSFEDTGCGIAPEIGRRVFEPFFSTKDPGQGTGLGLAVSYSIVQKHGGTMDFESTVGKSTVFRIELPVLSKAPGGQHGSQHHTTGG
jgi:signal transduction histidine kinase